MTALEFMWIAVTLGGGVALISILFQKRERGSAVFAGVLACVFGGFTFVQIAEECISAFFLNHTQNLTGLQVWWDLVMCVLVAFFLATPRARRVGMNVPAWAVFVGSTASIGLLAMYARLFWLERAQAGLSEQPAVA